MGKKIQNKDIIQGKLFDSTIEEAKTLIKTLDALEKGLLEILKVSKKISQTTFLRSFKDVKKIETAINNITSASAKLSTVQKNRKQLVDQLTAAEDKNVKGKLKLQQASKVQREILKDEIALENKQIGTLDRLTVQSRKLRRERSGLNLETIKGQNRLTEINKQLDKNNKEIEENSDKLKKQKINVGNYSESIVKAIRSLEKEGITLKNNIVLLEKAARSTKKNTVENNKIQKELKQTENRYRQVNIQLKNYNIQSNKVSNTTNIFKSGLGKLGGSLKSIAISLGAVFGAAAIGEGLRKIISGSIELSDALSDVRKTTGLTAKGVDDLSDSFDRLDTRTSKLDLLGIATAGGRLNVATEDIFEFTKAIDQVFVALGDELEGTAEEIATDLAKISSVFGIEEIEGTALGITKLGSAINFLGNNTKAQSAFIVGFTKLLGPVREAAEISATDILGLGATLDELGQKLDVAGSATTQILLRLGKDTSKFAKAANLDVKEFTDLVNTDINEALLQFAAGITKGNKTTTELSSAMSGLGVDGVRASNILLAIAGNTDLVRENQEKANKAFIEGTSLLEEFNIKNNNLAGNLAKIGKLIRNEFINSGLTRFLTDVTGSLLGTSTKSKILAREFKNLTKEADDQERTLKPLLKRYDELLEKGELNVDEQIELEKVISDIGKVLPTVVTKFDKYGKALDINRKKVEENAEASRKYRALLNDKSIKEARIEIERFTRANAKNVKELSDQERVIAAVNSTFVKTTATIVKLNEQELIELGGDDEGIIGKTNQEIFTRLMLIESLGAELTDLEKIERDRLKVIFETNKAIKDGNDLDGDKPDPPPDIPKGLTDKQLAARERLRRQIEDLEIDIIKDDLQRQLARLELEAEREQNALIAQLKQELITKEQFGIAELLLDEKLDQERQDAVDESNADALDKAREQAEDELEIKREQADENKRIEEEQAEARKEIQEATLDKIGDNIKDASNDRIQAFDDEISATVDRQAQLLIAANNGVLNAQESLAEEQANQAKLELAKKKEQQKQERLLAAFKILSALIESGEPVGSALPKTAVLLEAVPAVIDALPSFDVGIESIDTSGHQKADNKGGIKAIVHEKERIFTKDQNAMIGNIGNWEAANVLADYQAGRSESSPNVIIDLDRVVKAIENIPEHSIDYDIFNKIIKEKVKQGNKITTTSRKNRL